MQNILDIFTDSISETLKDIKSFELEILKMTQQGRLDSAKRLLDLHDKSSALLIRKMGFFSKLLDNYKPEKKA